MKPGDKYQSTTTPDYIMTYSRTEKKDIYVFINPAMVEVRQTAKQFSKALKMGVYNRII